MNTIPVFARLLFFNRSDITASLIIDIDEGRVINVLHTFPESQLATNLEWINSQRLVIKDYDISGHYIPFWDFVEKERNVQIRY